MADVTAQLVSVGAALAGAALTFAGSAWLERQRWRQTERAAQRSQRLQVFADLLQSTTDVARALRQAAERLAAGRSFNRDKVADEVDELVGIARRTATVARLVDPPSTLPFIVQIEDLIGSLYQAFHGVAGPPDSDELVRPARALIKVRDEFVVHLREIL